MPQLGTHEGYIDPQQVIADYKVEVGQRRAEVSIIPGLAILTDHPLINEAGEITPVGTYVQGLRTSAKDFHIARFVEDNIMTPKLPERILKRNASLLTHGTIVPLGLNFKAAATEEGRLAQKEQTDWILSHIDPENDVDGLTPRSRMLAGTAEAASTLWLRSTPKFSEGLVVVRGLGKVGRALRDSLIQDGFTVKAFDKLDKHLPLHEQPDALSEEDQIAVLSEAAVVFSATGHAHGLTPESFSRESRQQPKTLVGIGFGKKQGSERPVGEFAPKLVEEAKESGWRVIPSSVVGNYVTTLIADRTIAAAATAEQRRAA